MLTSLYISTGDTYAKLLNFLFKNVYLLKVSLEGFVHTNKYQVKAGILVHSGKNVRFLTIHKCFIKLQNKNVIFFINLYL